MADGPKIAILGAGSIGCHVGGAWAAAGCDVRFIGRERLRDAIAANGLTVSDQDGWSVALAPDRVDFATRPQALKDADIIALCVKSRDTERAAKDIARHGRRGATVISLQNGIANADRLKDALPRFEVVRGMVPYNVVRIGETRFHRASWGDVAVAPTPVTRALAERIGDRPGRLKLAEDMDAVAWGKLVINLNNAINALSGETILEELHRRDYRRVLAAAMIETLDLLDAAGIRPVATGPIPPRLLPHALGAPDWLFRNLFLKVQKIDPRARSSMADDFAAGRETEIDQLNGEVVRLARALGREAPVNEAIVALVKQAEAGIEQLWSAADLREYVLQRHRGAPAFGY